MKRFVEGADRGQTVRAIDVFVDGLDLATLAFDGVAPLATGRPAYHPAPLLKIYKIYIYGYFNRVQSSRRLERECQRNVELVWLTGRLVSDFKTIADFRKDNGEAIRKVCRAFVLLCRRLDLLGDASVAFDGSKFKAVNNRDKNFTEAKMKRRLEQIDESIARYLSQLDTAGRAGAHGDWLSVPRCRGRSRVLRGRRDIGLRGRHHGHAAEADDFGRQRQRAFRQAGLRLCRRRRSIAVLQVSC
jgi:transposase